MTDPRSVAAVEKHFPSGLHVPGVALVMGLCIGENAQQDAERIASFCKEAGATEVSVAKGHALMDTRSQVTPATDIENANVFGDISVPMSKLPETLAAIDRISVETGKKIFAVAHAGDGNLHPSVEGGTTPEEYAAGEKVLDQIVAEALKLGGAIAGEYGIGALERHELELQYSPETLAVHRAIQVALDANNILTPRCGI